MAKAKKSAVQTTWVTQMFSIMILEKINKNGTQIPDRFYSILLDLPVRIRRFYSDGWIIW